MYAKPLYGLVIGVPLGLCFHPRQKALGILPAVFKTSRARFGAERGLRFGGRNQQCEQKGYGAEYHFTSPLERPRSPYQGSVARRRTLLIYSPKPSRRVEKTVRRQGVAVTRLVTQSACRGWKQP